MGIISSEKTLRMLVGMLHREPMLCVHVGLVRIDLVAGASTPGGFEWRRYFMGRQFGVELFNEVVTWLDHAIFCNSPALEVRTRASPHPRWITFGTGTSKLSSSRP